ncbi:hypothetical protein AJ80_03871 [Polytolypa hystricis UAMH7299]|uniref:Amidase domain-containing protein n=1 Tax=Polytolypa hystricis (strain UAMH7299) TaxID=1447883 RepID=A0A2B7YDD3_POLH7|nr:hypothetical protein AJ80_03871 [Polytolypa hystricis UAMH7299]
MAQSSLSMEEELQITIGQAQYLLIPHQEVNFLGFESSNAPTLVLVYITIPGQNVSKAGLRQFRTTTLDRDDVFQSEFYTNVVFYGSKEADLQLEKGTLEELAAWNTKEWIFLEGNPAAKVAPGPLRQISLEDKCHNSDTLAGTNGRVIVPSRCYYRPSKQPPLDGARISVKDNIDIAGHKTTLCNRAWQDLYPEAAKHANCVQVLIDAGAIIVGKAKLQAMIMREEPLEVVEFTSPFNPRGNGYQVLSGSSHGSAAGIGSYEWLDFSIGSDSSLANGSGRKPAQYNGCFSIRPSTGIINTDGVIGQFAKFDMPVFFGRDLSRFSDFIFVWYGNSPILRTPSESVFSILVIIFQLRVRRSLVSLTYLFKALNLLCKSRGKRYLLPNYGNETTPTEIIMPILQNISNLREYSEKHGKPPFVHRAMHWQWDVSKKISMEERNMYWRRSEIYRHWLLDKVFKADSKDSITIMIFPIEEGKPNYRDVEPAPFSILSGYSSLNMSPMMRAPELTIIIYSQVFAMVGEITYESIVTKREEPLPIAVSVIGAPGTDLILANLVEKGMKAAGFATNLKTGRSIY